MARDGIEKTATRILTRLAGVQGGLLTNHLRRLPACHPCPPAHHGTFLVRYVNVNFQPSIRGGSNAPIAIPIQSFWIGSQNREEPHLEQNPRRTFSEERNQVTLSPPRTVKAARGTSVDAKTWPECLRHCEQWQASGGGKSPSTSNVTPPQRHDPLCMPRPF